jgi:cell division protein FtsI (penicillin-binding protein 3)
MALGAIVLIGRLALVQVLDGSRYASYAKGEVEQTVTLPAVRGSIYDRTGDLLAVSVPRYDVIADDFLLSDPRQTADLLAPILKVRSSTLEPELAEKNGYVVIAHQVDPSTESALANLGIGALTFASDMERVAPGASIFEPVLGGVNAAGEGDSALEYAYNAELAGRSGSEAVAEAPGGVVLPAGASDVVPPKPGESLVLSLDEPLQVEVTNDVARQMAATHSDQGVAVIEDVHTGAILAMVDLCTQVDGVCGPKGKIGPAPSNLALTAIYQPGSVMKLATISYALQNHLISPTTSFTVPYSINVGGYTFEDADVHPTEQLEVKDILAQSSNVGTIEISRLLGLNRLFHALTALGFGRLTGLNWPGESAGIIGQPSQWVGSIAASVPIGTGVAVTPMQVLDAYNAVANGGELIAPRLVIGTLGAEGTEQPTTVPPGTRALDPSTVAALVPMLEGVVQDGTAVEACVPGYTVAGKTGTAQVPETNGLGYVPGDWNATFVGFVPAEAPKLSGIVAFNHQGGVVYGGSLAAPVFAQIMGYALRHFDIAPPVRSTTAALQCQAAGAN